MNNKLILSFIKCALMLLVTFNMLACVKQSVQSGDIMPVCVFPNQQAAPGWVCGERLSGLALQAVGVADKSVGGENYMQDMAKIGAVKQLTELFKIKASKAVIQYLTSIQVINVDAIKAGASTINAISNKTLQVAKQYQSQIGPEGRMYVLVGLDKKTNRFLLEEAVNTSIKNDHALWLTFPVLKSLDEVAADIAAMED